MADENDKNTRNTPSSMVECYLKLAELRWIQFNKRRDFEWKVNYGLWTVFALLIAFGINENGKMLSKTQPIQCIFIIAHIIILIIYFIYMEGLFSANKVDQTLAFDCQRKAEQNAVPDSKNLILQSIQPPNRVWYRVGSYGFTLSLAILSVIVNIIKVVEVSNPCCK